MSQSSFVRADMLAPALPPVTERGAVKWLRENLFSGALNSILTLMALIALYFVVKWSLPWLANSVWNAASLRECRDIVIAQSGPDATGACWAMVRVRWNQFLFGLYPVEEYWRPTTAFALMFAALAPMLYYGLQRPCAQMVGVVSLLLVLALAGLGTDVGHIAIMAVVMLALTAVAWLAPQRLVLMTAVFPFIAFYLLWGGSFWGPVAVMAGFGLLYGAAIAVQRRRGMIFATLAVIGVFGVYFMDPISPLIDLVGSIVSRFTEAPWLPTPGFTANDTFYDLRDLLPLQPQLSGFLHGQLAIELVPVESDMFGGFLLAFVIGVAAITFSLPIGILLALGRQSDMTIVKSLSVGFIEFFRGVPLITVLFSANFMLLYFLPPRTNFDLILRVIIVVIIFASAYIAEVIRGGLAALPRGQYEAADALGLDYWQAQRLIIMPQALKISIPGIVSSFIGLFKDTTLVALVGLMDPLQGVTKIVRADTAWKGIYWEPYIFVGGIFFLVCFSMSRYSMYLERKLKTDHR